jgi:hypothetical protein
MYKGLVLSTRQDTLEFKRRRTVYTFRPPDKPTREDTPSQVQPPTLQVNFPDARKVKHSLI